ncbi:MAG TPA: helix-hairpin-helix domain-containing protein [Gemmatimonadaceae bacterium]|nr:helix-hairpin-helix domain-containing protein [Gemmatimonadaceae bacterium]
MSGDTAHSTSDLEQNAEVARALDEVAQLLEQREANPFRVQAYRNAAVTVRNLTRPAGDILRDEGLEGLDRLPGIGRALARTIDELVDTGTLALLERLQRESDPVALIATVPGVGHTLAQRLHDELDITTLEELEAAAHDGRLRSVAGFGAKRIAGIRDALATRLGRRRPPPRATTSLPPVSELLDVDREYREGVRTDVLPRIAPRRFNQSGEAWLPVLHARRGERHYTALFSNTARAHELGRTRDWVVLYYDDPNGERRSTVVTATQGLLKGRRVVRGREAECVDYYGVTRDGT